MKSIDNEKYGHHSGELLIVRRGFPLMSEPTWSAGLFPGILACCAISLHAGAGFNLRKSNDSEN